MPIKDKIFKWTQKKALTLRKQNLSLSGSLHTVILGILQPQFPSSSTSYMPFLWSGYTQIVIMTWGGYTHMVTTLKSQLKAHLLGNKAYQKLRLTFE